MTEELPRTFAGRYEVGELIGRGGMAEVHIGRDTRLGRTVAIKALRSDLLADPTFQARFRREAQSAASLNHPAIVSVYDSGEEAITTSDGQSRHVPFIVMEYVEGHTVRDLVRDGAALPIDEAIEITIGVLNALEYSHHSGIIHRDIKPANVMLTPTGAVKVMDFGIARAVSDTSATMTQTHAVVGTAQYLSPEQARGEVVDARSDLYSTGCLLYELLTGRPPFTGESAVAVAYQHVGQEAPLPSSIAPDVPEALDRITMKALAKDRDQRYSSAAAFRSDLEAAARSGVVSAPAVAAAAAPTQVLGSPFPPTTALPRGTETFADLQEFAEEDEPRRSKAWLWILLAVLLVAGGIAAYLLLQDPPEEVPAEVEVPVLTQDMDEAEATSVLREAGLTWDIQEAIPDKDVPEGNLVKWDPESGTMVVPEETPVKLWFSSGPDSLTMPDVVQYKKDRATQILEDAGFDPRNFEWELEHVEKTQKDIVTRTEPEANAEVSPDATITIYLATGTVDVPDVTGMQLEEAIDAIPDGIQIDTSPVQTNDYPAGEVISQSSQGYLSVDARIRLEYATAAPEPEPTETESPEPTETDSPEPDPTETETEGPPDESPTDGGGNEGDGG